MGLGINKDLEPLARQWRRAGGSVTITRSNHVRWQLPGRDPIRTGLTMSGRTAHVARRRLERTLNATARTR